MSVDICSVCGNAYPEGEEVCPVDGAPRPGATQPKLDGIDAEYRRVEREPEPPRPFDEGDWT